MTGSGISTTSSLVGRRVSCKITDRRGKTEEHQGIVVYDMAVAAGGSTVNVYVFFVNQHGGTIRANLMDVTILDCPPSEVQPDKPWPRKSATQKIDEVIETVFPPEPDLKTPFAKHLLERDGHKYDPSTDLPRTNGSNS